ncbi:MAG: hypothetical protein QXI97_08860 [Nitrososphaerota archaeon]
MAANTLIALSNSFLGILLPAILAGVGYAFWSTSSYGVMKTLLRELGGLGSGLVVAAFGLGLFVGPILTSTLLTIASDWRYPFHILSSNSLAILAALAVVLRGGGYVRQRSRGHLPALASRELLKTSPAIICLALLESGLST